MALIFLINNDITVISSTEYYFGINDKGKIFK